MENKINVETLKSVCTNLDQFDYLEKEGSYINVTEWSNGEGWIVDINGKNVFNLTIGQLEAINYLTKHLRLQK